ncbi:mannose-6-phosphate isomerase-like protein (cupin superfamily) [Rhodobium orientis]|uniref:Cupin n=1 Tax=Rhodobium orientis TaxID=34017 RepID=A0A327JVU6_9HYPH|nr:cupin domain-containing protein [Rhodobium orientis]MBB4304060.1 mannose-6-phosphate isomerase-like protein (cupin superfamily) [Rhodobium orientis]MBK5950735.1 cupin [Rhodobium orientis]RAI29593.1 cupin [Rhodobium orientis]
MSLIDWRDFSGTAAWDALDIAEVEGATVRVHWTDAPYRWHVNDGEEVFVVLSGTVDMKLREGGIEKSVRMTAGDIFHAGVGTEHVAHPLEPSRILVVEKKGSV